MLKLLTAKRQYAADSNSQNLFLYNQELARSGEIDVEYLKNRLDTLIEAQSWSAIPLLIYIYGKINDSNFRKKIIRNYMHIGLKENKFIGSNNLDNKSKLDATYPDLPLELGYSWLQDIALNSDNKDIRYEVANAFGWIDVENKYSTLDFIIERFSDPEEEEQFLVGISWSLGFRAKQVTNKAIRTRIKETFISVFKRASTPERVRGFCISDMSNGYLTLDAIEIFKQAALKDDSEMVRFRAQEALRVLDIDLDSYKLYE